MATAGSILANVRVQVGDTNADFLTDAIGLEWLTQAESRFCDKIMALDEIKDYTITSKVQRYDLPTNYVMPQSVMWYKNATGKLEYVDPSVWDSLLEGMPNSTGTPRYFTVIRQQLNVGPASPSTTSATALASGAVSTTTTTLGLDAASGTFRSRGFVQIGSEIVEYTGVSTTELTGCIRGVHGTDAASYASGATVTEIDMQLRYRKAPPALTATTASPEIPSAWHKYLEKYVMYLFYMARGDQGKAEVAYNEFELLEQDVQSKVGRRALALHRIRDRRHSSRWW